MNIGVIFAGGVGSRMNSRELPKQFLKVWNKPIIVHTIEHFEHNDLIDAIIVVCVADWIDYFNDLKEQYGLRKVKAVVPGGATGQLSIFNGLCAAEKLANGEEAIVLIHDGVRPMIHSDLITANIEAVRQHGNAITGSIVKETIVSVNESDTIEFVPERKYSRVAKAPQSFRLSDILGAHRKAQDEGRTDFIDSCTLMRHYGYTLHMVDGPYENIKITTPDDFYTMRAILQVREDAQIYGL